MQSDTELRSLIQDEIITQIGSRADDLDVQVLLGGVTVTGILVSEEEKSSLCDAIQSMPGVVRLSDDTMVVAGTSAQVRDADVARPWFPAG